MVANEDGQKCGTQLANDDNVKLVITGAMTVGNQALYNIIAAKKPVLVSNPVVTPDFLTAGTYAYTPGGPGVVQGMAVFVAKYLQNVKKVSVIYGDSEAEVFGAEGLLVPKLKSYGITDVTLQKISDAPTAPDVQNALTAAGADERRRGHPDRHRPGVHRDLRRAQVARHQDAGGHHGLCFGTPMTKHLADLGSTDTVPDGWYFGDYGYSYFVPEDASGMTTYLAKIQQYGPTNVEYTGFAGPTFANLMTATKFYNQLGPDASTAALLSTHQVLQGSDDDRGRTDELRVLHRCSSRSAARRWESCCTRTASGPRSRSGVNNKAIDPYSS